MYKPFGILSQFTPEGNRKALGEIYAFPPDCYPLGRLDAESEGLLIITNDASLNKKLLEPEHAHQRTYFVQVDGEMTGEAARKLAKGVQIRIDGQMVNTRSAACKIIPEPPLPPRIPPVRFRKNIPTSWISLTLTEGKNRQVRRMTAAVGFPTLRLVRVSIKNLQLENMQPGEVKKISSEELYRKLGLKT